MKYVFLLAAIASGLLTLITTGDFLATVMALMSFLFGTVVGELCQKDFEKNKGEFN